MFSCKVIHLLCLHKRVFNRLSKCSDCLMMFNKLKIMPNANAQSTQLTDEQNVMMIIGYLHFVCYLITKQ